MPFLVALKLLMRMVVFASKSAEDSAVNHAYSVLEPLPLFHILNAGLCDKRDKVKYQHNYNKNEAYSFKFKQLSNPFCVSVSVILLPAWLLSTSMSQLTYICNCSQCTAVITRFCLKYILSLVS